MNYEETLNYLYTKLPMYQRVGAAALKFDLANTVALLEVLDNPHRRVKTIHIAGTNGKGSSAHMLSAILQESGYKTGLYTSPHLKSFTERIRINGVAIPQAEVVLFVERILPHIDKLKPSFFEITFAMAMEYFAIQQVDIAVIEVGMGGRLDSTNVIQPEVCLITNISLDHQFFLGDSLAKIAREKAGIIKPGIPVIIGNHQSEISDVFTTRARANKASISFADQEYSIEQAFDNRINIINKENVVFEGLQLDLFGLYQYKNLPGVLKVCQELIGQGWYNITEQTISRGLSKVVANTGLKGRWQQLGERPIMITDTAHNLAGIAEVLNQISQQKYQNLHIVWGMVQDKDATEILNILPTGAIYYFVKPDIPRGMSAEELAHKAREAGLDGHHYPSVVQGIAAARSHATAEDFIFIGGSTFVVAEIESL